MATTVAELQVLLGLTGASQVTGGLREVQDSLHGVASAAGNGALDKAVTAYGMEQTGHALLGIAEGLGQVAEEGISFQALLQTIQNNTTMTTADVQELHDGVLALSRDSGAGLDVLATGFMKAMNIAGNTTAAMAELRVATESAVSTGGDPASTTNVLANAMHEYGLDVSHAATEQDRFNAILANSNRVMGVMHLAAAEGNMTLEQFSDFSGRAIGIAANLGVGLEDVSAAFTALTKHGFDPAGAQVQVVDMLTHMINPTKQMLKEIDDLKAQTGIDLTADFSAEGLHSKGLIGALTDIKRAFQAAGFSEDEATQHAMKLVNAQRGGLGLASLIGTGWADYTGILADLNDEQKVNTVTAESFARTQATVAFQLQRLRAEGTAMATAVGEAMLPAIGRLLGVVDPLLERLTRWVSAHAAGIGPILATVAGVVALAGAAATLGGTLLFASLGLEALAGVAVPLGATLIALAPTLALIAAGFALVGAAYRANFLGLHDGVRDLLTLARALPGALGAIRLSFQTGDFNQAFGPLLRAFSGAFGSDATAGLVLPLSGLLRGLQLLRDTFLTIREAAAGDWFGGQTDSINLFVRTIGRGVQLARDAVLTVRQALAGEWFGGQNADIPAPIRMLGRGVQLARDAIITIKQALAGQWVPDGSVQPFVLALGTAVLWGQRLVGFIRAEIVPALGWLRDHWAALSAGSGIVAIIAGLLGLGGPLMVIYGVVKLLATAWVQDWGGIREIVGGVAGAVSGFIHGTIIPAVDRLRGVVAGLGRFGGLGTFLELLTGKNTPNANALGAFLLGAVNRFTGGLQGATAGALHWLGDLAGRGTAALLGLATRFITWLTPHLPEILTGIGRVIAAIVGFVGTTALSLIRGVLDSDIAQAFWRWVGPAIPPLLTALGGLFDTLGTWVHGTVLPYLQTNLPIWGGAFAAWATDLWQNHLAPGLGTLFDSLGTWVHGTVLPYLEQHLPIWGGAFAAWATGLWHDHIEPGMGQLWTSLSGWISSTAPVIGKQALVWGAALVAGMWEGFAGHDAKPQTNLGQGILGTLNGVDPADSGAATGLMAYLNQINTSIDTWAATTGHEAIGRAMRTLFTMGPSVEDVGNAAIKNTQKLLGSGPTVKEVGDQAISWFNALADYLAIEVPQLASWDNMWTWIADGIASGMPQWLRDFLHISASPHATTNGAITETPGRGGGGAGGGGTTAYDFRFPRGGSGPITLNVTVNGITPGQVAQEIYDTLAGLLGESGGGTGAPAMPAGTVY